MSTESKSINARLGQIKRRLVAEKRLAGDQLNLALDVIGDGNTGDGLINRIAEKLKTSQKLDAYELHLMVDVFLLHAKLPSASACANDPV